MVSLEQGTFEGDLILAVARAWFAIAWILEDERELPGDLPGPPPGGHPPPSTAAVEGVGDQPALEVRLADVDEGVVLHPLAELRRGDHPLLDVVDHELALGGLEK
jgi:hypothetical protein